MDYLKVVAMAGPKGYHSRGDALNKETELLLGFRCLQPAQAVLQSITSTTMALRCWYCVFYVLGETKEALQNQATCVRADVFELGADAAWKERRTLQQSKDFVYDLVAVGAGAGGLVSAKQSARRGARSALIEQHLAGGDCLNVGCVPSKALLRCARAIAEVRRMDLGFTCGSQARIDFAKVMERMRKLRADIAPVDSHETSKQVGVDVYMGTSTFTGKNELQVGEKRLKFRKAVIATGGRAKVPPIPGLDQVPYLTNASLFNLSELPPRFLVVGAGPISLEMAQAFQRFGSQVTVLEVAPQIMGLEDDDAAQLLREVLEEEGVQIHTGCKISSVSSTQAPTAKEWPEIRVSISGDSGEKTVVGDALLIAAGRVPNVEGLGLEAAGVDYTPGVGIKVSDDLTTSNPDILAIGDVIERPDTRFTHMSGTMAGMAVQNALFPDKGLPVNAPSSKLSEVVVPRCTYTEPEVASCGISNEKIAAKQGADVEVYKAGLQHNDRAILEGSNRGYVKIVCRKGTEEILGATVVCEGAGEMLSEITLAVQHGLGLSQVARTVHPYPTMGEAIQQCALNYNRARWAKLEKKDS
ncbi:merA, partial [Symbiodinium pilosum]